MAERSENGLATGADGKERCFWCVGAPEYVRYHDEEWGRPVVDDRRLFEKLSLEGFQAGLSWLTILRKREAFRRAFSGFDREAVAGFGERKVASLLEDPGIVRHRGKIESVLNNARRVAEIVAERGSFAALVWDHEPPPGKRPERITLEVLRGLSVSEESRALSKELKRRGFSYVGPTTVYAFMQAMGLVNDHLEGCFVREAVERERKALVRPRPSGPEDSQ